MWSVYLLIMLGTLLCRANESVHVRSHIKHPVTFSFFNWWLIVETSKVEDHHFSAVLYRVFDVIFCSYLPHLAAVFPIHNPSTHPVLCQRTSCHVPSTKVPFSGGWFILHNGHTFGSKREVLRSDIPSDSGPHVMFLPPKFHFLEDGPVGLVAILLARKERYCVQIFPLTADLMSCSFHQSPIFWRMVHFT